jgi:hypothetical protein
MKRGENQRLSWSPIIRDLKAVSEHHVDGLLRVNELTHSFVISFREEASR